ncbi:MAG: hypothetical protein LBS12_01525 [Prevotellaceae bacterium]|jgi:hypothetical protein|nr:hypothetical protein [Prevotellaceae bacterium]
MNKPDAQLLAQATTINTQSHLHETEWQIEAARLTGFDAALASAENAYEANRDRATKNATTAAIKKAAFGELKHFESTYINYFEVNENVPDAAHAYMVNKMTDTKTTFSGRLSLNIFSYIFHYSQKICYLCAPKFKGSLT